jgi:hypothetical protein
MSERRSPDARISPVPIRRCSYPLKIWPSNWRAPHGGTNAKGPARCRNPAENTDQSAGEPPDGSCVGRAEMSKTQVTAALGLLKKSLPDLATVESKVSGELDVRTKEQRDAIVAAALRADA